MSEKLKMPLLQPNYREQRARQLAAVILNVLDDYIPRRNCGDAHDALLRMFYEADAEVITDADRKRAGLPSRNELGLSPAEHSVLEDQRLQAFMSPPRMYFCAKCGDQITPPPRQSSASGQSQE